MDPLIFASVTGTDATFGNIQIAETDDNTIDTTTGNLKLSHCRRCYY